MKRDLLLFRYGIDILVLVTTLVLADAMTNGGVLKLLLPLDSPVVERPPAVEPKPERRRPVERLPKYDPRPRDC